MLVKDVGLSTDKRVSIIIAGICQALLQANIRIERIDTAIMLADCLTRVVMDTEKRSYLHVVMEDNCWSARLRTSGGCPLMSNATATKRTETSLFQWHNCKKYETHANNGTEAP